MKVVQDGDLSELHTITQGIAKKIADDQFAIIVKQMEDLFTNNDRFGDLTYSGAMTFINTIGSFVFCKLFKYSCWVGTKFPDVDHSSRELFEDVHKGLRLFLDMPEISKTEYAGGIKKVSIKED